jgi:hypothetical protein
VETSNRSNGNKKLNKACFAIRSIHAIMPVETLKMVYFAYFYAIMSYGIIFWGNQSYSDRIFKLQKRLLGLLRILGGGSPVGSYLRNSVFYHCTLSVYF